MRLLPIPAGIFLPRMCRCGRPCRRSRSPTTPAVPIEWGDVSAGGGRGRDRQEWHGDVLVAQDPDRKPAWLEFSPTGAGAWAQVLPAAPGPGAGGGGRRAVADRGGVLFGCACARHQDFDK